MMMIKPTVASKIGMLPRKPGRLTLGRELNGGLLDARGHRKLTSMLRPQTRPSTLTTMPQLPSLKGMVVNVLGLVWGLSMLVNFLWPLASSNPPLSSLPNVNLPGFLGNIPIFEATVGLI